jgi:hypothetical protein
MKCPKNKPCDALVGREKKGNGGNEKKICILNQRKGFTPRHWYADRHPNPCDTNQHCSRITTGCSLNVDGPSMFVVEKGWSKGY